MPRPRKSLISVEATPYYHCVSRCVRRAFLCGIDVFTGQSYEHRRSWVEQRILKLGQVFCIDVCAYAVMSNHYHVVLHINSNEQAELTDNQVLMRWFQLYQGNAIISRYLQGESLCNAESAKVKELAAKWRERLCSISWFMKVLNEGIAREANSEDGCTGKFWEGRFKSQALLDEKALASCMAYVDLNPVRANMAETPEKSDHTSAQKRIRKFQASNLNTNEAQPRSLFPFIGSPRQPMPEGLPFKLEDYLELLDWTGRQLRENKHGSIETRLPPILTRLNIEPDTWLYHTKSFGSASSNLVGAVEKVKQVSKLFGYQRLPRVAITI
jgi:REP element-mobilizing transposase RayT